MGEEEEKEEPKVFEEEQAQSLIKKGKTTRGATKSRKGKGRKWYDVDVKLRLIG